MFLPFAAADTFGVVQFNFDWTIVLQFILAVFLPLLVALVTKRLTPGIVKAGLLALLTLVTTLLTEVLSAVTTQTPVDLFAVFFIALGSFVISVATYASVWDSERAGGKEPIAKYIQANVGVR